MKYLPYIGLGVLFLANIVTWHYQNAGLALLLMAIIFEIQTGHGERRTKTLIREIDKWRKDRQP